MWRGVSVSVSCSGAQGAINLQVFMAMHDFSRVKIIDGFYMIAVVPSTILACFIVSAISSRVPGTGFFLTVFHCCALICGSSESINATQ